MLKIINEEIKNDFLEEVSQCFKVNNAYSSHEEQLKLYETPATFRSLQ